MMKIPTSFPSHCAPPHANQTCARTLRLRYFEEVFTSQHWMMRIYRVLPEKSRDGQRLKNPHRSKGTTAKKGKASKY